MEKARCDSSGLVSNFSPYFNQLWVYIYGIYSPQGWEQVELLLYKRQSYATKPIWNYSISFFFVFIIYAKALYYISFASFRYSQTQSKRERETHTHTQAISIVLPKKRRTPEAQLRNNNLIVVVPLQARNCVLRKLNSVKWISSVEYIYIYIEALIQWASEYSRDAKMHICTAGLSRPIIYASRCYILVHLLRHTGRRVYISATAAH